jgi:hypothetical protein
VMVEMDEVMRTWSESSSRHLVAMAVWVKLQALLYADEGPAAKALLLQYWARFERAGFTRIPPWSVGLPVFKGTIALACATGPSRSEHLRTVARAIATLRTHRSIFAQPAANLLEAGLMRAKGRTSHAAALYASAAAEFDEQMIGGYAVAARVRQAELVDAHTGQELRARARLFFEAQSIVNPASWTRMYAPVAGVTAQDHDGHRWMVGAVRHHDVSQRR